MQLKELPRSVVIGSGADIHTIAGLLSKVVGLDARFRYCEPVEGSTRSGRIISAGPTPKGAEFPKPFSRLDIAMSLEKLAGESRYSPLYPPNASYVRGWEVNSMRLADEQVVLVWSTWVPRS